MNNKNKLKNETANGIKPVLTAGLSHNTNKNESKSFSKLLQR